MTAHDDAAIMASMALTRERVLENPEIIALLEEVGIPVFRGERE